METPLGQTLKSEEFEDDSSIGNIRPFKEAKNKSYKESIPLITSKNLTFDENKKLSMPKMTNKDSKAQKSESQHKVLLEEVPNWQKLTIDESAEILKKHICYHNEEGI